MELSFALVNSGNIRSMMRELLGFLERADADCRAACSSALVLAAERHAPSTKWHLDTLFRVFQKVGRGSSGENGRFAFVRWPVRTPSFLKSMCSCKPHPSRYIWYPNNRKIEGRVHPSGPTALSSVRILGTKRSGMPDMV